VKSISFILAPRLLMPMRSMGEEMEEGSLVRGVSSRRVDEPKFMGWGDLLAGVIKA